DDDFAAFALTHEEEVVVTSFAAFSQRGNVLWHPLDKPDTSGPRMACEQRFDLERANWDRRSKPRTRQLHCSPTGAPLALLLGSSPRAPVSYLVSLAISQAKDTHQSSSPFIRIVFNPMRLARGGAFQVSRYRRP